MSIENYSLNPEARTLLDAYIREQRRKNTITVVSAIVGFMLANAGLLWWVYSDITEKVLANTANQVQQSAEDAAEQATKSVNAGIAEYRTTVERDASNTSELLKKFLDDAVKSYQAFASQNGVAQAQLTNFQKELVTIKNQLEDIKNSPEDINKEIAEINRQLKTKSTQLEKFESEFKATKEQLATKLQTELRKVDEQSKTLQNLRSRIEGLNPEQVEMDFEKATEFLTKFNSDEDLKKWSEVKSSYDQVKNDTEKMAAHFDLEFGAFACTRLDIVAEMIPNSGLFTKAKSLTNDNTEVHTAGTLLPSNRRVTIGHDPEHGGAISCFDVEGKRHLQMLDGVFWSYGINSNRIVTMGRSANRDSGVIAFYDDSDEPRLFLSKNIIEMHYPVGTNEAGKPDYDRTVRIENSTSGKIKLRQLNGQMLEVR